MSDEFDPADMTIEESLEHLSAYCDRLTGKLTAVAEHSNNVAQLAQRIGQGNVLLATEVDRMNKSVEERLAKLEAVKAEVRALQPTVTSAQVVHWLSDYLDTMKQLHASAVTPGVRKALQIRMDEVSTWLASQD